ncbi:MAG: hypothetical protein GF307_01875 [candidate division Zixibacteria bacterium]|nr:hypothetical protein [candidate division Zixibacteria bacterium]
MNDFHFSGVSGLAEAVRQLKSIFNQNPAEVNSKTAVESHLHNAIELDTDVKPERIKSVVTRKRFGKTAAVDGGLSILLSSGNFAVGVCKASMVIYNQTEQTGRIDSDEFVVVYGDGLESSLITDMGESIGMPADDPAEWRDTISSIMALKEMELMNSLLVSSENIDCLLIDGALSPPCVIDRDSYGAFLNELYKKGIMVVGVSKSSTLRWANNCPLVSRLEHITLERKTGDVWSCKVSSLKPGIQNAPDIPDIYLCNLYSGLGPVLRLDIPSVYSGNMDDVISGLALLSIDPEFPGYPYPLVEAHRRARIILSRKNELIDMLRINSVSEGVDIKVFNAAFTDPHDKLNADVNQYILSGE